MKLKNLYQEIVKKGIESDVRTKKEIELILEKNKQELEKRNENEKKYFDHDLLFNPFADTRILTGSPEANIKSIIVGVDVDGAELLLVDRLREKGKQLDLVAAHHPQGYAYAHFYEVMDLQINIFTKEGVSLSTAENLLQERKGEVARRVGAANHLRSVDIARLLDINFLCMHTHCDNLAYKYLKAMLAKAKPASLGSIIDLLYTIPEYKDAARNNNSPKIIIGAKNSRCSNIHLEFTGGTEGPKDIYDKLASRGIDTIIAMHQSEEHFKKCKESNINVIIASHIASDNLGINIMCDYLESKEKFKIYEFSGFRRFPRPKHK